MTGSPHDRVVLLFCHGGSFTKDCWTPIIRRLQAAPLLQRVPCEFAAFNWRFHGDQKDPSVKAKLYYRNGDKNSARVDHPLTNWPQWTPQALEKQITKLREDDEKLSRRTHIIGVGHSMGATTLMLVETTKPGTLEGIIAFEPTFDDGSFKPETNIPIRDALVGACLAHQGEWDTYEAMQQHLKISREFRRWDREVAAEFLKQGVEKTDDGKRWRLVVSPKVEAALYSTPVVRFLADDLARAKCKIVLEHAQHTVFFHDESIQELAQQLNGQLIVADVIPKTTHSMCVEQPATCAQHILQGLVHFRLFQTAPLLAKL